MDFSNSEKNLLNKKIKIFEILPRLMRECGIDTLELSNCTGVAAPTIFRLCSNKNCNPTINTLIPIASYFNVSVEQLLGQKPLDPSREIGTFTPIFVKHVPLLTLEEVENWENIKKNLSKNKADLKFILTGHNVSENAFSVKVHGPTTINQFSENSFLIMERYLKPIDRDYVLVKVNDNKNVSLKQLLLDGDDYYFKPITSGVGKITLSDTFIFFGVMVQALINYRA